MASLVPIQEKELVTQGWEAQTLKVALLTTALTAAYDYTIHYTYTSVTAFEHAATTGYVTGGASIAVTDTRISSTTTMIDAANSQWGPGVTLTNVKYAVLYDTATLRIRALFELASAQSCTNSTFTLEWHTNGLTRIS
jgi:hypothetical protein